MCTFSVLNNCSIWVHLNPSISSFFPIITHHSCAFHWESICFALFPFPLLSRAVSHVHTASLLHLLFPPHSLSKGSAAPWGDENIASRGPLFRRYHGHGPVTTPAGFSRRLQMHAASSWLSPAAPLGLMGMGDTNQRRVLMTLFQNKRRFAVSL